jgi:hypothetical protein
VTIQANFQDSSTTNWSEDQKGTVRAAIASWESLLGEHRGSGVDPVISANFTFGSLGSGVLGEWSATSGPQFAGTDLYPWTPGMTHTIQLSETNLWQLYFDLDTSTQDVPSNQFDAYTVILHEIGHMLGFVDGFYVDDFSTGAELDKWGRHITGQTFDLGGLSIVLDADRSHLSATNGVTAGLAMAPTLNWMERREISPIELAMLEKAYDYQVNPEPATALLLGIGLLFLGRASQRARSA